MIHLRKFNRDLTYKSSLICLTSLWGFMLLHILYLIGIIAEAMTGALAAGRRRMDTFGVIIIARHRAGRRLSPGYSAGPLPAGWVKHPEYVIIVAVAAVLTTIAAPVMPHLRQSVSLVLDALGWWCSQLSARKSRWIWRRTGDRSIAADYRRIWRRTAGHVLQAHSAGFPEGAVCRHLASRPQFSILPLQHCVSSHDVVVIPPLLFGNSPLACWRCAGSWGCPSFTTKNHNAPLILSLKPGICCLLSHLRQRGNIRVLEKGNQPPCPSCPMPGRRCHCSSERSRSCQFSSPDRQAPPGESVRQRFDPAQKACLRAGS